MRVALLAAGSRGDYQPVMAVGQRLRARGHDVGVTATREYADLVAAAGLRPEIVDVDAMAYYREHLARHGMPLELRDQLEMLQGLATHMAPAVLERLRLMRGSYDGVVTTAMTAGWPGLSGWTPARAVLMMFVPALPSLRGDASLFSVVEGRSWRNLAAASRALPAAVRLVAPHPRATLGMARMSAFVAHSPRLVGTGRVAGRRVRAVGYPFGEPAPGAALAPQLEAWLDEGPPPLYVGMGSHTLPAVREVLGHAVQAAGARGLRVVLQAGSGLDDLDPAHVHVVGDVPHELLLPRTAAVVHHGGAGTTASALRAGRPQVVVPFTMDQPFFARRVHEIGVAAAPVPASQATVERLRTALRQALDEEVVRRAGVEADLVSREDGVGGAVVEIERALGG